MFRNQYDTDVTTWSPQGRLFQVEYAAEAVKQGNACVGVTSKTHAVIVGLLRKPSDLSGYQQKMFRIDDHIGIVFSGLTADARSLCKWLRTESLNHKFVYNAPIQTERLVIDTADKHQEATQSYVRRPYGVGLLIAGYDRTGAHIFQTEPSGNYFECYAQALGSRSQSAKTYLERNFSRFKDLSRDDLIREAVKAIHGCLEAEKELDTKNTVIGVVGENEVFRILTPDEVAGFLTGLGPATNAGSAVTAPAATPDAVDEDNMDMS